MVSFHKWAALVVVLKNRVWLHHTIRLLVYLTWGTSRRMVLLLPITVLHSQNSRPRHLPFVTLPCIFPHLFSYHRTSVKGRKIGMTAQGLWIDNTNRTYFGRSLILRTLKSCSFPMGKLYRTDNVSLEVKIMLMIQTLHSGTLLCFRKWTCKQICGLFPKTKLI